MAYALVGSLGTVATSGTTTFAAPTFAQPTTAGHLLIAWATCYGATNTTIGTPTGWFQAFVPLQSSPTTIGLFYKIAAGSDAAPVFPLLTAANTSFAQLGEFSGNAASSPVDRVNTGAGATASYSVTTAGTDVAAGELICYLSSEQLAAAGVAANSVALNNGATSHDTNNNAASGVKTHYVFGYGITTGNAAADSMTITQTAASGGASGLASFLLAAGAVAVIPDVNMAPMRAPGT